MDEFDIPIFKKTYNLYRQAYEFRQAIPKQDRHVLWQKVEGNILEIIENILEASALAKEKKLPILENASLKLNTLRVFVRLAHDTKAIDHKKYTLLQENIEEVGRMLGGWIRSFRSR